MKKKGFRGLMPLVQATNHELASYLGAVASQCERFLLGLEEGIYKNKTDKELIQKATEIMRINLETTTSAKRLVQEMSHYVNGIRQASMKQLDLRESIDKALGLLRYNVEGTNINIKKEYPRRLSKITASPLEVCELFFIIIDNAVEAVKEKGSGSIFIKVTEDKERLSVNIKDTGCGMTQEAAKRVFGPFFSAKPHNGRKGLGLFIAHEIMYSLNGSITCESKLGQGTSFCLDFINKDSGGKR